MKQKELVTFLKKLTLVEINELQTYVTAFHSDNESKLLLHSLCNRYPRFPETKTKEETIWQIAYPEQPFSLKEHNTHISKLYEIVKEFAGLIIIRKKSNEGKIERERLFTQLLKNKELYSAYDENLLKQERLVKKKIPIEIDARRELISLYHQRYFDVKNRKDKGKNALMDLIANLDKFYFSYRTMLDIEIIQRKKILNEKVNFTFLDDAIAEHKKSGNNKGAFLECLLHFYDETIYSSQTRFNDLQSTIIRLSANLQKEEKVTVLNCLLNVTSYHSKKSKLNFSPFSFKTFKYIGDNQFFVIDKVIPDIFFTNAIDTACKASELNWAIDFFEKNKCFLHKKSKTEIISITEAMLAFEDEQYENALSSLRAHTFRIPQHNLRKRLLLVKINFELNNYDNFFKECTNLKEHLNTISTFGEDNIKSTKNFMRIARSLFKTTGSKDDLLKICDDIQSCEGLFEKVWLRKKINSFGANRVVCQ